MGDNGVDELLSLNKKQLVDLILVLKNENSVLKNINEHVSSTNNKIESIERRLNLSEQYNRRESVEISGIPMDINDNALEDKVLEIYEAANVEIHGKKLSKMDISACHRIGKKGKTIVKLVNRKFAKEILYKGKDMRKDIRFTNIYVNNSFSKEFSLINYYIRKAHKDKIIKRYQVKNGINFIQIDDESQLVEVSHRNDLQNFIGVNIENSE